MRNFLEFLDEVGMIVLITIIALFSTILLAANFSAAESYDALAFMYKKFPVNDFIQELPADSDVAILDWSFGTDTTPIKKLLDSERVDTLFIKLINGPGYNNHKLGKYEPHYGLNLNSALEQNNPKLINHLETRAKIYCDLVKEHNESSGEVFSRQVKLAISPVLEFDHLSNRAQENMIAATKKGCATARIVLNPRLGSSALPNYTIEHHGGNPPACRGKCWTSLDGDELMDTNINKWKKRTRSYEKRFSWSRLGNCRHQGAWEDPRARTACPNRVQLREFFHATDVRPKPPDIKPILCKTLRKFKGSETWKPLAEDKGINDSRRNKPLIIANFPPDVKVMLIDNNSHEIGRLGFYGAFSGGGNRYYSGWNGGSGTQGYEIERKANRSSGSPFIYAKTGAQCIGPFIPGIRQGTFR